MKVKEKIDLVKNDLFKYFNNKTEFLSLYHKNLIIEWEEINGYRHLLRFHNGKISKNIFAIELQYKKGDILIYYPNGKNLICEEYGIKSYQKLFDSAIDYLKQYELFKKLNNEEYMNYFSLTTSEKCKESIVRIGMAKYLFSYDSLAMGYDSSNGILFSSTIDRLWLSNTTSKVIWDFIRDCGYRENLETLIRFGIIKIE